MNRKKTAAFTDIRRVALNGKGANTSGSLCVGVDPEGRREFGTITEGEGIDVIFQLPEAVIVNCKMLELPSDTPKMPAFVTAEGKWSLLLPRKEKGVLAEELMSVFG